MNIQGNKPSRFCRNAMLMTGLVSLFPLAGCNDDPVFPLVPEISFISITPNEIEQLSGDITITFHYQDGDGDLGGGPSSTEPDGKTIFIRDTRSFLPDSISTSSYTVPSLTPDTRRPSIQGEMEVAVLSPLHCSWYTPGCTDDVVIFEIYIRDRAGNVSNKILTDPVSILP